MNRDDAEPIANEWEEWRCPHCGRLQHKHLIVGDAIVETKCWNCKRIIILRLSTGTTPAAAGVRSPPD